MRQFLEKHYGREEAARRVFATGTPGSTLHQLCLDHGYTFLTFPDRIGGRFSTPAEENLALRYACLRKLLYDQGYALELLAFFEPRLEFFSKWWVQTFAESEGKEGKALYPVTAYNSEDLHATGQFIQQSSPILFETFLRVEGKDASLCLPHEEKKDYFDYLEGMDFWEMNHIAQEATLAAHSGRGIPCLELSIPAIDAHTLASLQ